MRVCVLGGGIVGATSALRVSDLLSSSLSSGSHSLTVLADRFSPDTTSDGVAGWWEPHLDPNTSKDKVLRWSSETFSLLERLWFRPDEVSADLRGLASSMCLQPGLHFLEGAFDEGAHFWRDVVYNFKQMDKEEMARMGFGHCSRGYSFLSYTLEPGKALPVMYAALRARGVRFVARRVTDLADLASEYDVVVNCCGAGARDLVGDGAIRPVRGHILKVRTPGVRNMAGVERDGVPYCYIIPTRDHVILGSLDLQDTWSTRRRPGDREELLRRCRALAPGPLTAPEVVAEWVGLRPLRAGTGVRLEREAVRAAGRELKVVHNYGHGGSGITLCWGCAGDAADLVAECITEEAGVEEGAGGGRNGRKKSKL